MLLSVLAIIFATGNNDKQTYMKRYLFFLLMLLCANGSMAQVTLGQCKAWARDNYPVIRQYDLVEQQHARGVD